MALSHEDGVFIGEVGAEAVIAVQEHFNDAVELEVVLVVLVVRDGQGVHTVTEAKERWR